MFQPDIFIVDKEPLGLRGEVAFDKEPDPGGPNARSLHTRFSLHLGAAPP